MLVSGRRSPRAKRYFCGELGTDQVRIDLGVILPSRGQPSNDGPGSFASRFVSEVRREPPRRAQRGAFPGIDRKHLLHEVGGLGVFFVVDAVIGAKQEAVEVSGVPLECVVEGFFGARAIAVGEGAGEEVEETRVVGRGLGGFLERGRRQGFVLLVEPASSRGGGDRASTQVGPLFNCLHVVELVEHFA